MYHIGPGFIKLVKFVFEIIGIKIKALDNFSMLEYMLSYEK